MDANGKLTAIGINAAPDEAVHGHQLRPLTDLYGGTTAIGTHVVTTIFANVDARESDG